MLLLVHQANIDDCPILLQTEHQEDYVGNGAIQSDLFLNGYASDQCSHGSRRRVETCPNNISSCPIP